MAYDESSNLISYDCGNTDKIYNYNLIVFENTEQYSVDVQGRVAVGGNAYFENFAIGRGLTPLPAYGTDASLVVQGNLQWYSGGNYSGNTIVEPNSEVDTRNISYNNANAALQPIRSSTLPINFVDLEGYCNCISYQYSTFSSSGSILIMNYYGNIYMFGNDTTLNIFKISANEIAPEGNVIDGEDHNTLTTAYSITIFAPEGSTNLLNVSGESAVFGSYSILRSTTVPDPFPTPQTFNPSSYEPGREFTTDEISKTMWNFYEATSIIMSSISLKGTLLAPKATMYAVSGNIQGCVIVNSMVPYEGNRDNHTEIENNLFNGCLPEVTCRTAPNGIIGKYVWLDYNNDGKIDDNEPGVPGVVVTLYYCNGTRVDTTTTNANGMYQFSGLAENNYYIVFSNLPAGTNFVKGNGVVDEEGRTNCFQLGEHEVNNSINVPILPQPTPVPVVKSLDNSQYPLINGTMIYYTVTFTAPTDSYTYNNFTVDENLNAALSFSNTNSQVIAEPNTEVPFTFSVDKLSNRVSIKFPNNELTNGKIITVRIAAILTNKNKVPSSLVIENYVNLIINNYNVGQSTSNIVETKFVRINNGFNQQLIDISESIAYEEAALAHILNAEGEKIQKMLTMATTTDELLNANRSVKSLVTSTTLLEGILNKKLKKSLDNIK